MKNCLVDFDGTLVDSSDCWKHAYRLFCQDNFIKINNNLLNGFEEHPFLEWIHLIELEHDYKNIQGSLLDYVKKYYVQCKPKKKVLEIIYKLKGKARLMLITREPIELVEYWLGFYNLDLFDEIKQAGEERREIEFYDNSYLLIDDNVKFCKVAKQSGIYVIGVKDHHNFEQKRTMQMICDLYID